MLHKLLAQYIQHCLLVLLGMTMTVHYMHHNFPVQFLHEQGHVSCKQKQRPARHTDRQRCLVK